VKRFPDGFLWGVGTSAFQIEGSLGADGRIPSIWDGFAGESGETGETACDHYRRWRHDVDLLASLGVNAYRFSLAWPRMGDARGVAHYDALIDALLEHGIEPLVTLYHWDLPAGLDWRTRETVDAFVDYANRCFDAYGDRVRRWITINEPWEHGVLGYAEGLHAPGIRDRRGSVVAMHHLLLAHGLAARAAPGEAGVAFSYFPAHAETESEADAEAARICDGYHNRWFLDPVLKGSYPEDMLALWEERIGPLDFIEHGDAATINAGHFIGVNYYGPGLIRAAPGKEPFPYEALSARVRGVRTTDGGYEIAPSALTEALVRLRRDYGDCPVYVTENGAIYDEASHDGGRVEFIREHVAAVHDAIEHGVDVRGYFHWSLMDNFEWALGYRPRFGLVHVDYETQQRSVKDSGRFYGELARSNGL
jgi:beta-glucosidase